MHGRISKNALLFVICAGISMTVLFGFVGLERSKSKDMTSLDNGVLRSDKQSLKNSVFRGDEKPRLFDYKAAMAELNNAKVAQDDPRLVQLIRDYYILPPSTEAYNLQQKQPDGDVSVGKTSSYIDRNIFNSTKKGFFIECGVYDGEHKSTSLFFEKERNWSGLLLEADPISFARLRYKNRKAYIMNSCLSSTPYPVVMKFNVAGENGRVLDGQDAERYVQNYGFKNYIDIQCFPVYSILLALNQLHVDFFSLDVEGAELNVLKTIPFDKVNIKAMLVEYFHINGKLKPLEQFLSSKGYETVRIERGEDVLVKKKEII